VHATNLSFDRDPISSTQQILHLLRRVYTSAAIVDLYQAQRRKLTSRNRGGSSRREAASGG
jgi:hypothetical protein